jgi:very-short-patch-repair endonuclease
MHFERKKRFCGTSCSAKWRSSLPHIKAKASITALKMSDAIRGKPRPECSKRMKENNPMHNAETRQKVSQKKQGRTFLARGGNGQTTKPQEILAEALNLKQNMEFVIVTNRLVLKEQFPSLPNHYKVDIAIPDLKIAIEVDGNSHKTPKWKFLDKRKTAIVNVLGWSVLRFWNEQILNDLPSVMTEVQEYMILRSKEITTTMPIAF